MAVDASAARAGGAVTYATELLPALAELPQVDLVACLLPLGADRTTVDALQMSGATVQLVTRRLDAARGRWKRVVAERSAEVVFTPTEIAFTTYGCPQVNALRSPIYEPSTTRGYPLSRQARFFAKRTIARRTSKRAEGFIAVSQFAADLGHLRLGVPRNKIKVVYHGSLAPSGTHDAGPAKRWLFVSNMSRYKNVLTLLEATRHIPDPRFRLRVAGGFDTVRDRDEIQRLVRDLADDRIELLGRVPPDSIGELFEWADGLAWPSYAETFGHPLAAAVQRGMAVVACDAASNREIAGEAAAYFEPPDDAEALGRKLRSLSQGGYSFGAPPRAYSWQRCAEDTARTLLSFVRD